MEDDRLRSVEELLDQIGRSCPPELIRSLFPASEGELDALALLGLRLTFVLDSSSLQRVLRVTLRHGKSGVLDGMKAGLVRPIAPSLLDREIRDHIPDIARDEKTTQPIVLELYEKEVRPLIEFEGPRVADVTRLRRDMSNPEDAEFLAVFLEVDAAAIVTEDSALASAGVKAIDISERGIRISCG